MPTSQVTDAIEMAAAACGGRVRDVFPTDRGAPSGSADFGEVCAHTMTTPSP
ncbi:hypothetical protein [Streptomyces sp. NBC_01237]|uniref:hypothetical protein n=1 Tax=Streptomyces sp. NBC_01237 TaxID=2903790 RepID=UPI002DD9CA23|nr:hypothetical protein [Streptomyces sp. NBC_01237]WRZ77326.1 hypothetical protein OG251_37420 [Streptomyces sp. NBC_01237]